MKVELFIHFNGNCREAVEFYAKVFKSKVKNLMTYGDAPTDPNHAVPEADKDKVMYAGIPLGNTVMMFCDMPSAPGSIKGSSISPTVSIENKDEITRLYNELKEGGEAFMEPQPTFFSELFGMVKDKFGIFWQFTHYVPEQ